jgi:hypothetical protein
MRSIYVTEQDARFEYPLSFVNRHILGCFEASKACAILPGKAHLFHSEFLKRDDKTVKGLIHENAPVDFYTEVKYSPCSEVSWYLHTREKLPVWDDAEQADPKFVEENAEGVIGEGAREWIAEKNEQYMNNAERRSESYIADVVQANAARSVKLFEYTVETGRSSSAQPNGSNGPKEAFQPEISNESVTDTFGCKRCAEPHNLRYFHSRACKKRRSRFDKQAKELSNEV